MTMEHVTTFTLSPAEWDRLQAASDAVRRHIAFSPPDPDERPIERGRKPAERLYDVCPKNQTT